MLRVLIFSLTLITVTMLSYLIGHIVWEEGIDYTFPLFASMLGAAIFSALFFDGYIFKDVMKGDGGI